MAKETGKKRKLEAEQGLVTPKRQKHSTQQSTNGSSTRTKKNGTSSSLKHNEPTLIQQRNDPSSADPTSTRAFVKEIDPSQQRKSEKRKLQEAEQESSPNEGNIAAQTSVVQSATAVERTQRKLEKVRKRKGAKEGFDIGKEENTRSLISASGWQLSPPGAGRFLEHDPIFVLDEHNEECLLAATPSQIQLLGLESSLLIRTHTAPEGRSIICFTRSPNALNSVDISYDNGFKVTWDWITSAVSHGTFPAQEVVTNLATATLPDHSCELFYITQRESNSVVVGGRRDLYTTQRLLRSIQVLHDGAYIICRSATAVLVGARKEALAHSEYVWVEIPAQIPVRCVEARLVFENPIKTHQSKRPGLSLALGNARGQILLYSDLGVMFAQSSKARLPSPRVLHWHREPVSAIKFSRDGSYLISGGKETVLVMWQLDTGKKQYLPHLTAEIERIVVSPEGSKYALQMGDNSIMVLSTSELKPVANFAGLQLPTRTEEMEAMGIILPKPNAILHPQDSHQLLLSVSSTQPKGPQDIVTRPFLQAFDIRNSRHISRQALVRNNVTDFNTGPEQTPVTPPDVTQLAVSADGSWLATIDEWIQPGVDLEHVVSGAIAGDLQHVRQQQETRREVHLKFWRWDDIQQLWTLTTKIEAPHNRTITSDLLADPGHILKLVSDPVANAFATIGEDSKIRIWRPRSKAHNDKITWVCKRTVSLPLPTEVPIRADSPMEEPEVPVNVNNAYLAYSPDGSVLACAQASSLNSSSALVHFVSTTTGQIVTSRAGLIPPEEDLVEMAFLDRYFVALTTESVRLWDLVEDRHFQTRNLLGDTSSQDDPMLAVNHNDDTFAVLSYRPVDDSDTPVPTIRVYKPTQPEAMFETDLSAKPSALLAGNRVGGYTILFEDGTIRTLASATSTATKSRAYLSSADISSTLAAISEPAEEDPAKQDDEQEAKPLALPSGGYSHADPSIEDDRPVVRPEQLASIFDAYQSFAMPPVRDMFQSVVELFGRKPMPPAREDGMEVVAMEV